VVGEFLGDTDKLLVRCNPLTDDYGSVLVALPIDRRKQWPVWLSLAQFVEDFAEHDGEKCWPH
jgi:hypothetical protein